MQSMNLQEDEDQLCALLKVLRTSLKTLSAHLLVTKPQWTAWERAWRAAHHADVAGFERAINDLDSLVHFHHHEALGLQGAQQYLRVRNLIRCIQDIWPYSFEAH